MDKQDFQEQDFMEILMRLPCPCKEKTLSLQGENVTLAGRAGDRCNEVNK